jgi:signal transduction histidine kinase
LISIGYGGMEVLSGVRAYVTRQLLVFSRGQVVEPTMIDLSTVVRDMESMLRRMIGERITLRPVLAPTVGPVMADAAQLAQIIMNLVVNARESMPDGGQITIETANIDLDEAYCRSRVDSRPGPHVMIAVSDTGVGMDPRPRRTSSSRSSAARRRSRARGSGAPSSTAR